MTGKIEKWYPLVTGFVLTSCYLYFLRSYRLSNSLKDLFSAATTLSGIAIGFLATAESILFTIDQTRTIKRLKGAGVYKKLINYFTDAIKWSFVLATLSFVGLVIDFTNPQPWHYIVLSFWLFCFVTAGLSCYRVIDVFASLLRSLN